MINGLDHVYADSDTIKKLEDHIKEYKKYVVEYKEWINVKIEKLTQEIVDLKNENHLLRTIMNSNQTDMQKNYLKLVDENKALRQEIELIKAMNVSPSDTQIADPKNKNTNISYNDLEPNHTHKTKKKSTSNTQQDSSPKSISEYDSDGNFVPDMSKAKVYVNSFFDNAEHICGENLRNCFSTKHILQFASIKLLPSALNDDGTVKTMSTGCRILSDISYTTTDFVTRSIHYLWEEPVDFGNLSDLEFYDIFSKQLSEKSNVTYGESYKVIKSNEELAIFVLESGYLSNCQLWRDNSNSVKLCEDLTNSGKIDYWVKLGIVKEFGFDKCIENFDSCKQHIGWEKGWIQCIDNPTTKPHMCERHKDNLEFNWPMEEFSLDLNYEKCLQNYDYCKDKSGNDYWFCLNEPDLSESVPG